MTDRPSHPALRSRRTCDHDGGRGIGAGHVCKCVRDADHTEPWHGCVCGATWTNETELELTGERSDNVVQLFAPEAAAERVADDFLEQLEGSIAAITARRIRAAETEQEGIELLSTLLARLRSAYGAEFDCGAGG